MNRRLDRAFAGRLGAGRIAFLYGALGIAWIVFSGLIFDALVRDADSRGAVELGKGIAYVLITGALLYALIRRELHIIRAAEDELREANVDLERLAAFLRLNPHPVVVLDADGRIELSNAAARSLARESGESSVGGILPRQMSGLARTCIATGQGVTGVEHEVGDHIIRWSLFPVPEHGTVYCYGTDYTQVSTLGERLARAEDAENRDRLTSGIAHDLRNLLGVVRAYAQFLEPRLGPDSESREYVSEIVGVADNAEELVRRFSALGKDQPQQSRLIDLTTEVLGFASFLRHAVPWNAAMRFNLPEERLTARVDPVQFERALLNLVVNAGDALGGESGQIVVECRHEEVAGRPYAAVSVSDDGCGMDSETLERIYEPFFTTKPMEKGTGLGLSVVRAVVEQAEGWVDVQSAPGEGTTFTLRFPLAATAAASDG